MMKGMAILAVIASHFSVITLGLRNNALAEACTIFMLPLFFVVSGYFSWKGKIPFNLRKTVKRCLTLLLPLFSWSVIETVAFSRPWDYYPTHGFAGLWFFWALFLLVVVFSAIECSLGLFKQSLWIDIAAYGGVYGLFILMDRLCDTPALLDSHLIVNYYRYFALGIFIRKYAVLKRIMLAQEIIPLWLLAFCAEWWFFECQNTILIFLGSIAGVMIAWHACERMENRRYCGYSLLARIGRMTLPLYCIHWLFLPHGWNLDHTYFSGIGAMTSQFAITMGGVSIIVLLSISLYRILSLNNLCRMILFGEWPRK